MSLFSSKIWRAPTTAGIDELHVESGALIEIEEGGMFAMPVQTVSSTATELTNYGLSIVKTTVSSSVKKTNTMDEPDHAGLSKIINFTIKNTTKSSFIDLHSGVTVVCQTTETAARYIRMLQVAGKETFCSLVSLSTAKWLALSKTTNISFTTSSTAA